MFMNDPSIGRIEVKTMQVPEHFLLISGTYTASGRVLVTGRWDTDPDEKDWYRLLTMNDDGTDINDVYAGAIPQKPTANGVRFMCFSDNQRVLLGDYVLECEPDLDHTAGSSLIPLDYPDALAKGPGVFAHWSEIIVSQDGEHMCWTRLTGTGSGCYLGRLVREEDHYLIEDVCLISSTRSHRPDPDHPGYSIPEPPRGGEVKQFVHGGRAVSEAGAGESLTDGLVQSLDSEDVTLVTNTPGYEETTMFSPDETLGVVMSPRFSVHTNCAIFGLLPHPHSMAIHSLMNVAYMYAIAGVRSFRKGNIGPALIEINRSVQEGRSYQGVNLSDPEGKWVYCSPISWAPDSTKAMWVETTRASEGTPRLRLRIVHLLDKQPADPVPTVPTPSSDQIPYAAPLDAQIQMTPYPIRVRGLHSGFMEDTSSLVDGISTAKTVYEHYSDDGKTFTDGGFTITTPMNMFAGGRTSYEGHMKIQGEHQGEMNLYAVFDRKTAGSPAMLIFDPGEDGLPLSRGYAAYDGETLKIEDMEP